MAIACPVDLDTRKLRDEIRSIYVLRYDRAALAQLPAQSTASFAGVANPHRVAPIEEGSIVVDIGCGAGMDLLLADVDLWTG